jgi:glycosyltransferase involved in cell wall biosynthesis
MNAPPLPLKDGIILHIAWVRWWSALAYHALSLAGGMNAIGRRSLVAAPPGSPLEAKAKKLDLAATGWGGLASARPDRLIEQIRALRGRAFAGSIVGVFVHTGAGHVAAAAALRGTPAPLLRVRSEIRIPGGGPLQRWLYGRGTDRVLLSGRFMEDALLRRLAVPSEKIRILPAGIDCRHADAIDRSRARAALRERMKWPAEARVVGMLARYSPVKGHRDLVDAARVIAARDDDVRFFTAGPVGQVGREQVARWVREAGLADRFAVLDAVADPIDVAAGFDVAVIASRGSEAVCRSALEYMALGLPVVATDVNVIPETVGDAGLLVPPADPAALAQAVMSLLDDPARSRLLSERASFRVRERFEITRTALEGVAILEEAREERHAAI